MNDLYTHLGFDIVTDTIVFLSIDRDSNAKKPTDEYPYTKAFSMKDPQKNRKELCTWLLSFGVRQDEVNEVIFTIANKIETLLQRKQQ